MSDQPTAEEQDLQTRLDYLFALVGSACIVWNEGKPTSPMALEISMGCLNRAYAREIKLRGESREIAPRASELLMGEVSAVIQDAAASIGSARKGAAGGESAMNDNINAT